MKIILFMHMIKKVIKVIKKKIKNHQNIENKKFIKPAFKIPNALNKYSIFIIFITFIIFYYFSANHDKYVLNLIYNIQEGILEVYHYFLIVIDYMTCDPT